MSLCLVANAEARPITVDSNKVIPESPKCDHTMKITVDHADTGDEYNETNNIAAAVDLCS